MIPQHQTTRLRSLDVFRGITIALMILVNSPGNRSAYPELLHATWNGCTFADLVFPFFIFIVGLSSVFSLSNAKNRATPFRAVIYTILKRTCFIFLLGLFLNAFPHHFNLETLRFYGVLQRIALCYLASALLCLTTTPRTQALITIIILFGYWFVITTYSPLPIDETNNITAVTDRWLFSMAHLYGKTFDPEGLLSTLPAIATALIGNLTGYWLLSNTRPKQKLIGLLSASMFALSIGWIWSLWFPFNKTLWTSSYVVWTAGLGLLTLAGCYLVVEIKQMTRALRFFEVFGVNALAAYVLHVFFLKAQALILLPLPNGELVNIRLFITDQYFGWASSNNASLLYALSYTFIWFIFLFILYRKKIYIKI